MCWKYWGRWTQKYSAGCSKILDRDVHSVIEIVDELVMQGRELSQLSADFTWYLRNLLLVRSSDHMEDVLDVSSENLARLKEEAQMIEDDAFIVYPRIFRSDQSVKIFNPEEGHAGGSTD